MEHLPIFKALDLSAHLSSKLGIQGIFFQYLIITQCCLTQNPETVTKFI